MKFAAYGYPDRARPAAIEVVGKLAKHDNDRAIEFLLKMLDDPESRTVNAAGAALAEVGDARAEPRLQALAESAPNPELRERAKGWVETLRKKKA
jgi:HEAT repeat protein